MREADTSTQLHTSDLNLFEDIESRPGALLVLSGDEEGELIKLDKNLLTGGRLPENEIYLSDGQLSRRHFQIVHDGTSYYVRDVRSTNGTFLNERKLDADSVLINGDIIRVGKIRLKFISGNDPELAKLTRGGKDSTIDELTGCYSRHYLNTELDRAFKKAITEDTPLCLLVFTIDTIEEVDKHYGYQGVDFLLTKVIHRIQEQGTRSDDVLARYSDHEFILMPEGAPLKRSKQIADRLLELFDNKPIRYRENDLKTTLSIGIAEVKLTMKNAAELFQQADHGLYESKKSGGNKRTVAGASTFDIGDNIDWGRLS